MTRNEILTAVIANALRRAETAATDPFVSEEARQRVQLSLKWLVKDLKYVRDHLNGREANAELRKWIDRGGS